MTTSNGQLADVIEGLVESANDHGIKVGGEWRNVSKFKPVDLPDRGTRVRLELDAKGFIRDLEVLDSKLSEPLKTVGVDRDRTITRLAVLRSAVQLAAGRADLKSTDVLKIAELFEVWVLRKEPSDD